MNTLVASKSTGRLFVLRTITQGTDPRFNIVRLTDAETGTTKSMWYGSVCRRYKRICDNA